MMMENCEALANAMFEKMRMTVDDEKGHYALHVMNEMLKPLPDMRFYIGADLAKTFDLYALIEYCFTMDRFRASNTKRIMFRLIHLYMKWKPEYEEVLQDLVFNLGIEEE
jgi:hypothetical protein